MWFTNFWLHIGHGIVMNGLSWHRDRMYFLKVPYLSSYDKFWLQLILEHFLISQRKSSESEKIMKMS